MCHPPPAPACTLRTAILVLAATVPFAGGCSSDHSTPMLRPDRAGREYRAIAGISMGAYGALNLGTKHVDLFGTIGALGGPVDLTRLLDDMARDNFEVKQQTDIPRAVGADFTFDHMPPYPERGTRIDFTRDLVLAFGNPFLHHSDPARSYLASDSEPARILRDDAFGSFFLPLDPRGFLDGGDSNADGLRQTSETMPDRHGDVLLVAKGSLAVIAPGLQSVEVGERALIDLTQNGVFDVGEGLVLNFSEPFTDGNGNGHFDPDQGETYMDVGLDGVPGTLDYGEGNAAFDYDPDRAHWLAEDPLTRLSSRTPEDIARQRLYLDVGTGDQLGFAAHYANLVAMLRMKGLTVAERDDFPGSCTSVPDLPDQFLLVRYDGGHIGIPSADDITDQLAQGDFCGAALVWRRLLTLLAYVNSSFLGGDFGTGGPRPVGDVVKRDLPSPALTPTGQPTVTRRVVVYRPPGFFNTSRDFPIVYFLGGYGQEPDDWERVDLLMDLLIASNGVQNMFVAFLPGGGGIKGSFYVNHVVPHVQAADADMTTGRYEDSIVQDLLPAIELDICEGRLRR